jgi:hypothetical protein
MHLLVRLEEKLTPRLHIYHKQVHTPLVNPHLEVTKRVGANVVADDQRKRLHLKLMSLKILQLVFPQAQTR